MSVTLTVTPTRSQVASVGSLASYRTYYDDAGHFWECWAEIETSASVRGIGKIKRHPLPNIPAPADTWTITAYLQAEPTIQAKITEISLAFNPLAFTAHQPFVRVSTNCHEPRAGVTQRAWEFGSVDLPIVH